MHVLYLQVQAFGDDGKNSSSKTTALLKKLRYGVFELWNFVLRPALCSTNTKQSREAALEIASITIATVLTDREFSAGC